MKKYICSFLMIFLGFFPSIALSEVKELIVLIPGIDFGRTCSCNENGKRSVLCKTIGAIVVDEQSCANRGYMFDEWQPLLRERLGSKKSFPEIKEFLWSGDMFTHGEDLKTKFERWFVNNVCGLHEECRVAFIAHSWGTVILADFLASLPNNSSLEIKDVFTYGSPTIGAQIKYNKEHFLEQGIENFLDHRDKSYGLSRWYNIVHEKDPIAWDYRFSNVLDMTPEHKGSSKGRFPDTFWGSSEFFPVSNSEFDPKYLGTSVARKAFDLYVKSKAMNRLGKGKQILYPLFNKKNSLEFDFNAHNTSNYQPERIANIVSSGMSSCFFPDLDAAADDIEVNAIKYLCEKNIVSGDGKTHQIRPRGNINRAEFSKIIAMALLDGVAPTQCTVSPFPEDFAKNKWYCRYVRYLAIGGIIKGYGNASLVEGACPKEGGYKYFCPTNEITFAETAKIILISIGGYSDEILGGVSEGEPWYEKYMECAGKNHLFSHIQGVNTGVLEINPDAKIDRGSAFFALSQALKNKEQNINTLCK